MRLFKRLRKQQNPKAPSSPSITTTTSLGVLDTTNPLIKSTNFSSNNNSQLNRHYPPSNEIRHKSEIEIEVKHNQNDKQQTPKKASSPSYSGNSLLSRTTNKQQQQQQRSSSYEEQSQPQPQIQQHQYQLQQPKPQQRRWADSNFQSNTTHTQTHPPTIDYVTQLKSITEENLSKNEKKFKQFWLN